MRERLRALPAANAVRYGRPRDPCICLCIVEFGAAGKIILCRCIMQGPLGPPRDQIKPRNRVSAARSECCRLASDLHCRLELDTSLSQESPITRTNSQRHQQSMTPEPAVTRLDQRSLPPEPAVIRLNQRSVSAERAIRTSSQVNVNNQKSPLAVTGPPTYRDRGPAEENIAIMASAGRSPRQHRWMFCRALFRWVIAR